METEYNNVKRNKKEAPTHQEILDKDGTKVKKEPVVTNKAKKTPKKGLLERLVISAIGPNGIKSVGSYVGSEIIGPAVKNIVYESFTSAVSMMMFGDDTRRVQNTSRNRQTTSGNQYHSAYKNAQRQQTTQRKRRSQSLDGYVLETHREARIVLDSLLSDIDQYQVVSVADYYDLIGVPSEYTDNGWGWYDLKNSRIIASNGGYEIILPAPVAIE